MSVNTKNLSTYDEYLQFIFSKLDNVTKQETVSSTNYNTWSSNINGLIQSGLANHNAQVDSNKLITLENRASGNVNYEINKILFEKIFNLYFEAYM